MHFFEGEAPEINGLFERIDRLIAYIADDPDMVKTFNTLYYRAILHTFLEQSITDGVAVDFIEISPLVYIKNTGADERFPFNGHRWLLKSGKIYAMYPSVSNMLIEYGNAQGYHFERASLNDFLVDGDSDQTIIF